MKLQKKGLENDRNNSLENVEIPIYSTCVSKKAVYVV